MTDSVDLGERLESFVSRMVDSGRYRSRSDVLREGLRLVEEREARFAIDAAIERGAFDKAIEAGLADIAAGRVTPIEDVRREFSASFPIERRKAAR